VIESADNDQRRRFAAVLGPRQVAHLTQVLDAYRAFGYRPQQLALVFLMYRIDAEIAEGQLRLAVTGESILEEGAEAFALPAVGRDGDGPYFELLDTVTAAQVRQTQCDASLRPQLHRGRDDRRIKSARCRPVFQR